MDANFCVYEIIPVSITLISNNSIGFTFLSRDLNRGPQCDNTYEVPFGHLMPRQQKQYSFDGQLGSMSSMQDHFNSAIVPPTTPFLTQQIQRSCSMMQRPPLQPLQFYTHNNDS